MKYPINVDLINQYVQATSITGCVYSTLVSQYITMTDNTLVVNFDAIAPLLMSLITVASKPHSLAFNVTLMKFECKVVAVISLHDAERLTITMTGEQVIVSGADIGQLDTMKLSGVPTNLIDSIIIAIVNSPMAVTNKLKLITYLIDVQNLLTPDDKVNIDNLIGHQRSIHAGAIANIDEFSTAFTGDNPPKPMWGMTPIEKSTLTPFNELYQMCSALQAAMYPQIQLIKINDNEFEISVDDNTSVIRRGFNGYNDLPNCTWLNHMDGGDLITVELPVDDRQAYIDAVEALTLEPIPEQATGAQREVMDAINALLTSAVNELNNPT